MRAAFLGTAAARPTPERNVPPCSWNTIGPECSWTAARGLNANGSALAPRASVHAIVMSHAHADHLREVALALVRDAHPTSASTAASPGGSGPRGSFR